MGLDQKASHLFKDWVKETPLNCGSHQFPQFNINSVCLLGKLTDLVTETYSLEEKENVAGDRRSCKGLYGDTSHTCRWCGDTKAVWGPKVLAM